jgi:hypothetical protein
VLEFVHETIPTAVSDRDMTMTLRELGICECV